MLQKERLTLIGAPPSPYTRKMIALLRYRHIPYEIIWGNPGELLAGEGPLADLDIEPPKPVLLPTFLMRDERGELKTVTDSTPIIRRLEDEFEGRSVIPEDPALCFLNYLLVVQIFFVGLLTFQLDLQVFVCLLFFAKHFLGLFQNQLSLISPFSYRLISIG